jgi:hypothetical protein
MKQETMKLSVDTGSLLIDIDDKGEIIGQFRFNPNDLDIVKRYDEVVKTLEAIQVPENSDENTIFEISDELKKQMDYLLNYNVSSEIFTKCNPLTLTASGDFYIENVLEGIAGLIEKTMNQRLEKKKAKIRKATAKYHK